MTKPKDSTKFVTPPKEGDRPDLVSLLLTERLLSSKHVKKDDD